MPYNSNLLIFIYFCIKNSVKSHNWILPPHQKQLVLFSEIDDIFVRYTTFDGHNSGSTCCRYSRSKKLIFWVWRPSKWHDFLILSKYLKNENRENMFRNWMRERDRDYIAEKILWNFGLMAGALECFISLVREKSIPSLIYKISRLLYVFYFILASRYT